MVASFQPVRSPKRSLDLGETLISRELSRAVERCSQSASQVDELERAPGVELDQSLKRGEAVGGGGEDALGVPFELATKTSKVGVCFCLAVLCACAEDVVADGCAPIARGQSVK